MLTCLFCSLTGILEGDMNRPLDVGVISGITEQVANALVNAAQADLYIGRLNMLNYTVLAFH